MYGIMGTNAFARTAARAEIVLSDYFYSKFAVSHIVSLTSLLLVERHKDPAGFGIHCALGISAFYLCV
jgi:hypothetical protein